MMGRTVVSGVVHHIRGCEEGAAADWRQPDGGPATSGRRRRRTRPEVAFHLDPGVNLELRPLRGAAIRLWLFGRRQVKSKQPPECAAQSLEAETPLVDGADFLHAASG